MVRLTPPYYCAIVFFLLFAFIKGAIHGQTMVWPTVSSILAHLTYTQGLFGIDNIDGAYWTLCIEAQFYLLFASCVLLASFFPDSAAHIRRTLIIPCLVLPLGWPAGLVTTPVLAGECTPYLYAFVSGVVACWALVYRKTWLIVGAGYACMLVAILIVVPSGFMAIVTMVSFILYYAGVSGNMQAWLSVPSIQFIGRISYSIYLLHDPITGAGFFLAKKVLGNGLVSEMCGITTVLFSIVAVSCLMHVFIERPSIRVSRVLGGYFAGSGGRI